jgi:hypothetical protein
MQWGVVRKAVLEQFEASGLRSCQLASLLLSDRVADAASLMARKASCADLSGPNLTVPAGIRRLVGLGANLPLLFRLLAEAAIRRSPDQRAVS